MILILFQQILKKSSIDLEAEAIFIFLTPTRHLKSA